MNNCSICGKKIVLVPSAAARARKFGGKASDYTKLFTAHAECTIIKNREDVSRALIEKRLGADVLNWLTGDNHDQ